MKLSLDIRTSLSQTLTPQQIQYLKLLQLPLVSLEQHVMQELEQNPMLEEVSYEGSLYDEEVPAEGMEPSYPEPATPLEIYHDSDYSDDYVVPEKSMIDDQADPFEFYKMIAQDDNDSSYKTSQGQGEEDDNESFQIKDETSFYDELRLQLRLLPLNDEEFLLGEYIIGNVDDDGYLRRDMREIVEETNTFIAELNIDTNFKEETLKRELRKGESYNPARQFAVSDEIQTLIDNRKKTNLGSETQLHEDGEKNSRIHDVTIEQAERVLKLIQSLDPPGIASRTIQECLIAQCKSISQKNAAQKLALEILVNAYEPFTM